MNRHKHYLILPLLAVLAILAFWRRSSDVSAHKLPPDRPLPVVVESERRAPETSVAVHAPAAPAPKPVVPPRLAPRPDDGTELLEQIPSYEGKHMRDYTEEEREEVGLTNEKLFAFAGATNLSTIAYDLDGKVDPKLVSDLRELVGNYRDATLPYAPADPEMNLPFEREMLARLEKLDPKLFSDEARGALEFIRQHVKMWENGEAAKLVENKMKREDDTAKRIALRSRDRETSPSDADGEDGNK